jgi:hypothetical protein
MVAAHQGGQHQGRMNNSLSKMSEPGTLRHGRRQVGMSAYRGGLEVFVTR